MAQTIRVPHVSPRHSSTSKRPKPGLVSVAWPGSRNERRRREKHTLSVVVSEKDRKYTHTKELIYDDSNDRDAHDAAVTQQYIQAMRGILEGGLLRTRWVAGHYSSAAEYDVACHNNGILSQQPRHLCTYLWVASGMKPADPKKSERNVFSCQPTRPVAGEALHRHLRRRHLPSKADEPTLPVVAGESDQFIRHKLCSTTYMMCKQNNKAEMRTLHTAALPSSQVTTVGGLL